MKIVNSVFLIFLGLNLATAQIKISADSEMGSGYQTIINGGLAIEDPDCVHSGFGPHITQKFDDLLNKNVFQFHSHIDDDNDRCEVFDRVRMEIKGGPGSSLEAQHPINSTSYYRWKFKIAPDFVGTSSFCHIFQNKIKDGDDSLPVITFTLRASTLQLSHSGGDSGTSLGVLASVDLSKIRGRWVEAYMKQFHSENGRIEVTITDLASKSEILSYKNNDIDLWRDGASYDRPKWGMYRLKSSVLKDEIIEFADFCISESSDSLCPADNITIVDVAPPTAPTNLSASNIGISNATISWTASMDNLGVDFYTLYQDGLEVWTGKETSIELTNLSGNTAYDFYLTATDEAGNKSVDSETLTVMTQDNTTLPAAASNPSPEDNVVGVSAMNTLSWDVDNNTVSSNIYLGTEKTPPFVIKQTQTEYDIDLMPGTQYYWQIGTVNDNGETRGPIWTFTTSSGNNDFPWEVYRANEKPNIETSFLEILDAPAAPTIDQLSIDPNDNSNSIYTYYEEGEEKFRWRYSMETQDTALTIVARIKAINADINCVNYFEIKGFGWREKVRVNQSTVKLERSSPVVEEDLPFDILADFHIFRMTMVGNVANIYLDENPIPFATGNSTTTDSGRYFEFGKSGSNNCGCDIDWIAIQKNTRLAPREGEPLPSDLFLPTSTKNEYVVDEKLIIYPNPFDSSIKLKWDGGDIRKVELIDITGKLVLRQEISSGKSINTFNLKSGIYGVRLISKNRITARTIIKS